MFLSDKWTDYEILDAGNGEKFERWGKYTLLRPDPQVIWQSPSISRQRPDGHYFRSNKGGGKWEFQRQLPEKWTVSYRDLKFNVRPTGFKHTGLFPEQAVNWDFIISKVSTRKKAKVLNLFAYTGGATLAAAYAGADVVHVDASRGMIEWAKENVKLSGLGDRYIRFFTEDCEKLVEREIRRGNKYDGIIMDPPSYGRGPGGEIWKMEDKIFPFVEKTAKLLSDDPLFFLINSYTTGLAPAVIGNILTMTVKKRFGGQVSAEEVGLPISPLGIVLPCGASGRWEKL